MNQNLILVNVPAPLAAGLLLSCPSASYTKINEIQLIELISQLREDDYVLLGEFDGVLHIVELMMEMAEQDDTITLPHFVYIPHFLTIDMYIRMEQLGAGHYILGQHVVPELLRHVIEKKGRFSRDILHQLWLNDVDVLLAALHITPDYEGYPLWRDILLASEYEMVPIRSVYQDLLKHIAIRYQTDVIKGERSLRHMFKLISKSEEAKRWLLALGILFSTPKRNQPTITQFYKACFYFLRRRIESNSLQ